MRIRRAHFPDGDGVAAWTSPFARCSLVGRLVSARLQIKPGQVYEDPVCKGRKPRCSHANAPSRSTPCAPIGAWRPRPAPRSRHARRMSHTRPHLQMASPGAETGHGRTRWIAICRFIILGAWHALWHHGPNTCVRWRHYEKAAAEFRDVSSGKRGWSRRIGGNRRTPCRRGERGVFRDHGSRRKHPRRHP